MADLENMENIAEAIRLTQKIRASVSRTFSDLSNGFHNSQGNEKKCLNDLQKSLLAINNDYNALEKVGNSLNPIDRVTNSFNLSLDPGIDKTPLYSQLLYTHKWITKTLELSNQAFSILNQSPLHRSVYASASSKRLRRQSPISHSVSTNALDVCLTNWDRSFPDMSFSILRPLGNCGVVQVTVGRAMNVLVILRGLIIEWVRVKGFTEDFFADDGKINVWSKSKYQVFQMVTDHASAAMLHFYSPVIPDVAVKSFLTWLQKYSTLFSASCHKCNRYLQSGLPPTWRDFRTGEPYHEVCRG
ncbi:Hypothetical predicted protein [Octopus vulgaris]|uniref:Uncharacterized protein n=2 Tax=Octopus TaxID=6643 RepID=A0AA36AQY3_OCTVU|nr:mediator of RNA polymerase II transcription subunit 27 [Octopus sinensis]CAI9720028.1 Hypothetical predicted protein [Octopus vulgaris]